MTADSSHTVDSYIQAVGEGKRGDYQAVGVMDGQVVWRGPVKDKPGAQSDALWVAGQLRRGMIPTDGRTW